MGAETDVCFSGALRDASDAAVALVLLQVGRAWTEQAREIGAVHEPWMYWSMGRVLARREEALAPRCEQERAHSFREMTRMSGRLVGWRWSVQDLDDAYRFYLDEPDVTAERVLVAAATPSTAGWDLARRFPLSWAHYRLLLRRVRLAADRRRLAAMAVQRGWAVMHLARAAKVHGLSNAMNFSQDK